MISSKKIGLSILGGLLFAAFPLFAGIQQDAEACIRGTLGEEIELTFKKLPLDKTKRVQIEKNTRQKFFRNDVYVWKIEADGAVTGYAILDNVLGKAQPITFLVVFDPMGVVVSSCIVKYRESHGGQVKSARWQKQFVGKSSASGFKVGRDVDGISGATISANSVSRGISKLCALFPYVKKSL